MIRASVANEPVRCRDCANLRLCGLSGDRARRRRLIRRRAQPERPFDGIEKAIRARFATHCHSTRPGRMPLAERCVFGSRRARACVVPVVSSARPPHPSCFRAFPLKTDAATTDGLGTKTRSSRHAFPATHRGAKTGTVSPKIHHRTTEPQNENAESRPRFRCRQ